MDRMNRVEMQKELEGREIARTLSSFYGGCRTSLRVEMEVVKYFEL